MLTNHEMPNSIEDDGIDAVLETVSALLESVELLRIPVERKWPSLPPQRAVEPEPSFELIRLLPQPPKRETRQRRKPMAQRNKNERTGVKVPTEIQLAPEGSRVQQCLHAILHRPAIGHWYIADVRGAGV